MFDRLINRCVFVMKHASMEVNTFLLYRLISKNIKRFPERYTLCSCMHVIWCSYAILRTCLCMGARTPEAYLFTVLILLQNEMSNKYAIAVTVFPSYKKSITPLQY